MEKDLDANVSEFPRFCSAGPVLFFALRTDLVLTSKVLLINVIIQLQIGFFYLNPMIAVSLGKCISYSLIRWLQEQQPGLHR